MILSARTLRVLCAVALALCAACSADKPRPGTPPRCLLLITVQGLRADHVTSYGYIRQTTYTRKESSELVLDIDRMAETGIAFHNAFSPTGEPHSSLAAVHTGLSPLASGCLGAGDSLRPGVSTLAEDFAAAGYKTAAFVGADEPLLAGGLARGFAASGEFATDVETLQAAITWLQGQATDVDPIFLWVHFGELREPFTGEPLADLYSSEASAGAGVLAPDGGLDLAAEHFGPDEAGDLQRRLLIDRYDGALSRTSNLLHVFLEYYRFSFLEEGLFDDSAIVICGTNGLELAEREGRVGVGQALVDECLRVPLIMRHPASLTGKRIYVEPVTLADVAPTMRDWFGIASESIASESTASEGRSLLAICDSYIEREFDSAPAQAWLFEGGELRAQSLRDERWRATYSASGVQLFDLQRDPYASFDVAAEYPALIERLRTRLVPSRPAGEQP